MNKNKFITLFVSVLLFSGTTIFAASEYKIDKSHSYIGFKLKHLGVATVRGEFDNFSGDIILGDDNETRIDGEVNVDSIDTSNEKRDKHLKSGDFFEEESFPLITFKTKSVKRMSPNVILVTADLTIKGVTREIIVPFSHSDVFVGPGPLGTTNRRVFESEFDINRKDFNINFSKVVNGNLVVSDIVTIIVEIEGIEK